MATNTTHYNLVKPAYTEPADIGVINGDMDLIDSALHDHDTALDKVENSIAIVATGNTHAAITSGQYVYVKEHTALADGLYTASTNIAANATLSSSNLTAVSGGGMNTLKASIDTLNSKFVLQSPKVTISSGYFTLSYPSGFNNGNTTVFINHVYTGGTNPGYTFTIQLQSGNIIVYTRNFTYDGGMPPDNTILSLILLFVKS